LKARAPGKVVVSGAYSVLEGAPAIVAAVDRYVIADGDREAELVTGEVREAITRRWLDRAPWFDASALRENDRKLGLGSSAAILVASLGAGARVLDEAMRRTLLERALEAHRAAQGGGSGIDVWSSCLGGWLSCRAHGGVVTSATPWKPPRGLVVEVWAAGGSASTAAMLQAVTALRQRDATLHRRILATAAAGAEAAVDASDATVLVVALRRQYAALAELGEAAGVPIVDEAAAALGALAARDGAAFGPSGAGGGDVALHAGTSPSSARVRDAAREAGMVLLDARLGAAGLGHVS
jgi:phosphomevalonate kinase